MALQPVVLAVMSCRFQRSPLNLYRRALGTTDTVIVNPDPANAVEQDITKATRRNQIALRQVSEIDLLSYRGQAADNDHFGRPIGRSGDNTARMVETRNRPGRCSTQT